MENIKNTTIRLFYIAHRDIKEGPKKLYLTVQNAIMGLKHENPQTSYEGKVINVYYDDFDLAKLISPKVILKSDFAKINYEYKHLLYYIGPDTLTLKNKFIIYINKISSKLEGNLFGYDYYSIPDYYKELDIKRNNLKKDSPTIDFIDDTLFDRRYKMIVVLNNSKLVFKTTTNEFGSTIISPIKSTFEDSIKSFEDWRNSDENGIKSVIDYIESKSILKKGDKLIYVPEDNSYILGNDKTVVGRTIIKRNSIAMLINGEITIHHLVQLNINYISPNAVKRVLNPKTNTYQLPEGYVKEVPNIKQYKNQDISLAKFNRIGAKAKDIISPDLLDFEKFGMGLK